MLCLRPQVPEDDDFSGSYCPRSSTCSGDDYGLVPTNYRVSSSNYKSMWRRRRRSKGNRQWSWSFSSNDVCSTYNSDIEEKTSRTQKGGTMCTYRYQLEQEVRRLQKQLQEEIDLHSTLANAVEQRNSTTLVESPNKLPDQAKELLDSVALLETAVGKLEEELEDLQSQLSRERRERNESECHSTHTSSLGFESVHSLSIIHQGLSSRNAEKTNKLDHCRLLSMENLWGNPNRLSEEMVSCMKDIFLFLSDNDESSKEGASNLPHQWKPNYDSPMSAPAKSTTPLSPAPPFIDFGTRYSKAVQVSWLSVGRRELNYGADALKRFRLLVEQLAKVDPSCMRHDEKLAFWINLYNAMIMHAYLAYGFPRSDVKLLSLMQKATYNVGGHSITAADIEFIILKMKSPAHHPQIALCLVLHKLEKFGEQEMYAIDHPEPLLTFALSCGMQSSPAVRIFRPETVNKQLKESLKDYVQASIGISTKGKVVVPKLLHSYAKAIVTDVSMPAWICQFLCSERAAMVRAACTSSRVKLRFLGAREFTVVPFDSRFRYLFLLD